MEEAWSLSKSQARGKNWKWLEKKPRSGMRSLRTVWQGESNWDEKLERVVQMVLNL